MYNNACRGDVAQLVRALCSHRRGLGFEPQHPYQKQMGPLRSHLFLIIVRGSKGFAAGSRREFRASGGWSKRRRTGGLESEANSPPRDRRQSREKGRGAALFSTPGDLNEMTQSLWEKCGALSLPSNPPPKTTRPPNHRRSIRIFCVILTDLSSFRPLQASSSRRKRGGYRSPLRPK